MTGWIKLNRSLLNSAAWRDCTLAQNRILITLMLNAAYKPHTRIINGNVVKVSEGQLAVTLNNIVNMCNNADITVSKVRTALKLFEAAGIIKVEPHTGYTLITVNAEISDEDNYNYSNTYDNTVGECDDTAADTDENNENTAENAACADDAGNFFNTAAAKVSQTDNKALTEFSQSNDNAVALEKEINNKIIKDINTEKKCVAERTQTESVPDIEQVRLFAKENGISADAEKFFYHYQSVGWMMGRNRITDWKAALRKWAANGMEQGRPPVKETVKEPVQKSRNSVDSYRQREYDEEELMRIFDKNWAN